MKLCKDCKFCSYKEPSAIQKLLPFLIPVDNWLEYSKCMHDGAAVRLERTIKMSEINYVTGEKVVKKLSDYSYCGTMRSLDWEDYCGPEAKWWEPKEQ